MAIGSVLHPTGSYFNNTAINANAWDTLPHSIFLAAVDPPPNSMWADAFELLDRSGTPILADRNNIRIATPGKCALIWIGNESLRPALPPPPPRNLKLNHLSQRERRPAAFLPAQ